MKRILTISTIAVLLIIGNAFSAKAQQSWSGTKVLADGENITDDIALTGDVTIEVEEGDEATISGAIAGPYSLTKTGEGILIINGSKIYTGTTTINGGVLQVKVSPLLSPTRPGILFNTSSVLIEMGDLIFDAVLNGSMPFTFNKVISGSGNLQKQGSATLRLTAENTYTGVTVVREECLQIGNGTSGSINSTSNVILSGMTSTLRFEPEDDLDFDKIISGVGKVEIKMIATGYVFGLSGNHTYTGGTSLETTEMYLSGTIKGDVSLDADSYLGFVPAEDFIYEGVISGDGNVYIGGGHKTTFTGTHSYTGKTTIGNGTLAMGEYGYIPNTSEIRLENDNSKLDFSAFNDDSLVDVNNLNTTRTEAEVILGDLGLVIICNDVRSYSGKITGTSFVSKYGEGTWAFAGTHNGTGTLDLYQGKIELSADWNGGFESSNTHETTLIIDGDRYFEGALTVPNSKSAFDFDLTADSPSKISFNGGFSFHSGQTVALNINADTEGTYDLIEGTDISLDNFTLNLTGTWTNGELVVNDSKLQLGPKEVGINDIENATIELYPNPTNGIVNIQTNDYSIPIVKVYNLQGMLLFETRSLSVDLSGLINGMYILNVDGKMRKIIKH